MHTNTQADLGITSIRQPTCEEDEKVLAAKTFKASLCLAAKEAQSSLKDYSVCSPPQKPSQAGPAERSEALTEDLPAWLVKLKAATSLKNTWKAG